MWLSDEFYESPSMMNVCRISEAKIVPPAPFSPWPDIMRRVRVFLVQDALHQHGFMVIRPQERITVRMVELGFDISSPL